MKIEGTKWRWVLVVSGSLIVLGGLFFAGIWFARQQTQPRIPANFAEQVVFPLYMPSALPAHYTIQASSYKVIDSTLFFRLVSSQNGTVISVAEEAKPKDFDFTAFYQQQLHDIKNLQNTPYPSVLGKTDKQQQLLSITTDKTWLLLNSTSASADDLRAFAQSLHQQ